MLGKRESGPPGGWHQPGVSVGLSGREGNSLRAMALKTLLCNSPCLYEDLATWPILSEKGAGKRSSPEATPFPAMFPQSPRGHGLPGVPGCCGCPVCPLPGQHGQISNEEGFGHPARLSRGQPSQLSCLPQALQCCRALLLPTPVQR